MPDILELILEQTSPDNNLRRSAELEFSKTVNHEPTESLYLILELALNGALPIGTRQACLLQIKRLVPKFWSLGFSSFIGPPISQDLKPIIRSKLLNLAVTSADSKLRSGAAYAIVQIASVDFPDEWPELMNQLFSATVDYSNECAMLGGLQVLTDLFDDLITEEQFWEGGVGNTVIHQLDSIFENNKIAATVKNQAIKLYESVLAILQSPEAFKDTKRKQFVITQISTTLNIFTQLIQKESGMLIEVEFKSNLYNAIASIIGQFHQRIPNEIKTNILSFTCQELSKIAPIYNKVALNEYEIPPLPPSSSQSSDCALEALPVFNNLIYNIFQAISSIQHDIPIAQVANLSEFLKDAVVCSALAKETVEEFESDLNKYVSDMTGLSMENNPRDSILDFWGELNKDDVQTVCLDITKSYSQDKRILEAQLFTLEGILSNDNDLPPVSLTDLLSFISFDCSLVTARCFLLLPKYFEKFGTDQAEKVFTDMMVFTEKASPIIQISTLISCTYYQHVFEFSNLNSSVQQIIFKLAFLLINECEEDGLPVLLEAITSAISINPTKAASVEVAPKVNVIEIIFKIAFKDPGNVQLISDASDCLSTLLEKVNVQDYLIACEKSLPFIFQLMEQSNGEYTPELYLSLELLSIIIKSGPEQLPSQIFEYAFPILRSILLKSSDNQILQSGGEIFNELIQKASQLFIAYRNEQTKESGMELMMKIVYRFLSPQLSDSAASRCGSIVCSLISRFQYEIPPQIITQILQATVNRLVIAKEPITIENLIMVFCQLVLLSPADAINFLSSMTINDKSGLATVLPIWFDSYQVTRGFEQIKQNSLALAKIFTIGDSRIENLIVNGEIIPYEGDLIITRSRAKTMPDKYTRISASLKILKLLVGELQFQCQQPGGGDNEGEEGEEVANDDDGDDGWEDLDDIGVPNYEKLKSYVDEETKASERNRNDESLKQLLIQFFKECTAKNLGNFGRYYEQLSDHEKRLISECIIF
ncbi:hypothetical protein KGF56_002066 [Candida oxycetoniae]|uniref:Importin N-terminal domain-containing protein n=1 Tax=Candida oxycetoniae TaxID=497107 RepID=A0AAI9SYQ1_9ASCO|nr:uncharacterized protein KGF56_002066 [Candida oxycetoniae]KAI3405110.2 hypothetical protein KGF56_002066 [Candida oxycetoniae]